MKKKVVVIVQTSSDCNLDCDYCYVKASTGGLRYKMSIEKINRLIKNCSFGFDEVKFCWHGGEPILAGFNFYEEVIRSQKEINEINKIEFRNTIQTNGLLLTNQWLDFFKKNKFSMGISFDAPPEINRLQRANKKGISEVYIADIASKLKQYKMPLNVLCVVSKFNVLKGKEIFDFFNNLGVNSYSLLLMMKTPLVNCPESPTNEELSELYKTTFELWLRREHRFKVVEPIETIVRSLLGEKTPRLCSFGNHCLKRMITITSSGNVIPCGSFVSPEFILGDIYKNKLLKIFSSQSCDKFRNKRAVYIQENCNSCEFISICRGGCREVAYWHTGEYDGKYPYCESRKEVFIYIRKRLKKIMKESKSGVSF